MWDDGWAAADGGDVLPSSAQWGNEDGRPAQICRFALPELKASMDCFVARELLRKRFAFVVGNDDEARPRDLAAYCLREVFVYRSPLNKGRRECRALDAPAASRTIKNKVHEHIHHRSHRRSPAFPTQWFTDYGVLSSVRRAFWPPSPARLHADLTPASGCQDHTSSPSASECLRQKHHLRPPHPAPRR